MLTPSVRGNAGCYRPFTVKAPEGSILNPQRPAAVNLRTRTGWYLGPTSSARYRKPRRQGAGLHRPARGGEHLRPDAAGRTYSDLLFMGGGQGAWAAGTASRVSWPTSAANTSIELFEARPGPGDREDLRAGLGRPRPSRGGLGQRGPGAEARKRRHDDLVSVYGGVGNGRPACSGVVRAARRMAASSIRTDMSCTIAHR